MNRVKLGEIAEIYDGAHATPKKTSEGPIYLGLDAISDDCCLIPSEYVHLSEEDYQQWTKKVVPQAGDIVFSYEATIGRYARIPEGMKCALGRRLAVVRPCKDKVDTDWLFYYFRSPAWTKFIENHVYRGSTVNRVSIEDYPSYPVEVPNLSEQRKVSAILGAIDDKIALNKRLCAELEETARLVYDYWFTQFDFPDENGKPYKSSGGKMVWNEELKREIPEGWKTARASDLFDLERGYSYSSGDLSEQDEVPFISLACFGRKLDYRSQELKHLKDGVRCSSWVKPNDMLIACTDLTRGADIIGCPIRVPDQFDKYAYSMDLAKVINLSRDVKRGYLYQSLRTNWFHKFAKGHTSGTNVIHLNLDVFKWFSLAIPPVKLQERYDGICHYLFTLSDIELREDVELVATRDSLLPMLMNGQIKVSIASDASGTVDAKATS